MLHADGGVPRPRRVPRPERADAPARFVAVLAPDQHHGAKGIGELDPCLGDDGVVPLAGPARRVEEPVLLLGRAGRRGLDLETAAACAGNQERLGGLEGAAAARVEPHTVQERVGPAAHPEAQRPGGDLEEPVALADGDPRPGDLRCRRGPALQREAGRPAGGDGGAEVEEQPLHRPVRPARQDGCGEGYFTALRVQQPGLRLVGQRALAQGHARGDDLVAVGAGQLGDAKGDGGLSRGHAAQQGPGDQRQEDSARPSVRMTSPRPRPPGRSRRRRCRQVRT